MNNQNQENKDIKISLDQQNNNHTVIKHENSQQKQQNNEHGQGVIQRIHGNVQEDELLYVELLSMGFEELLIREAIRVTKDLDKAIEYIIKRLEGDEKPENNKKTHGDVTKMMENEEDFQDLQEDYKMIFLVRMDLKMGLGKIAAQVAHATLKAYKQMVVKAGENDLDFVALEQWKEMGQKKIVVKVNDQAQLTKVLNIAKQKGINSCYIRDAGLTQIASGSMTVGALGPAASSELDLFTKQFKLL